VRAAVFAPIRLRTEVTSLVAFLKRTKPQLSVLIILAISLFAWAPLLTPAYFFQAHDAPHSVFFLVEFDQTFRDGYLWPRWSPDFSFGYGYPLFNIYSPLAFYAAEILHLLGLSFVAAVKAMYIMATAGAGLAMYLFARRLFGREAGLLAAAVYMLIPYRLLDIYVRSSFSEFVALALLPLVLWAFAELIAAPSKRRVALAGLVYGILALTHHTSLFTFTPFLAIYILYLLIETWRASGRERALRAALNTALGGVLGLALAAVYLVPMLAELRYINLGQWTAYNYSYDQHFVYISQLLSPFWGYGYSGPGPNDGMSFQLGAVALVLVIFGGWLALARRVPQGGTQRGTVLLCLAMTAAIVWLMSPAAQFAWTALPIASLVQFPWRLLGLTAITMSVVAGSLLARPEGEAGNQASGIRLPEAVSPDTLILLLVVVLGSFSYTLPQYTPVEPWREQPQAVIRWDSFSPPDRVAIVAATDVQPTSGPMEAQYLAGEPLQVATLLTGTGTVQTLRRGGASNEVLVHAGGPATVEFYTFDYPGWQVTMDGQAIAHRHEPPYGLITADVPVGEHRLVLRMGTTPPRLAGGIASLLALAAIGVGLFGRRIWRRMARLL
jgi:hypothetical protein